MQYKMDQGGNKEEKKEETINIWNGNNDFGTRFDWFLVKENKIQTFAWTKLCGYRFKFEDRRAIILCRLFSKTTASIKFKKFKI